MNIATWTMAVLAGIVALQANYWLIRGTSRLEAWIKLPRCSVCKEKCRHVTWAPGLDHVLKPTPLCEFHLNESIDFHRKEAEERYRAERVDGDEWKDGPQGE